MAQGKALRHPGILSVQGFPLYQAADAAARLFTHAAGIFIYAAGAGFVLPLPHSAGRGLARPYSGATDVSPGFFLLIEMSRAATTIWGASWRTGTAAYWPLAASGAVA
jgi:hypothetical protein